jgi:hypothetical protein
MAGILGDIIRNAQGLQGLAAMKMQMDESKAAQERQKIGMEALNKYRESAQLGQPDDNAFTTAVMNVPDAAKNVLAAVGIRDNLQKKDAASFALKAANIVESPEQFVGAIDARIKYLQDAGRDPKDSIALREQYLAGDKEGVRRNLKGVAAALVGDGTLDQKIYESTFGEPEKMNEYQRENLALQKRELDLRGQQLSMQQSGMGALSADERKWNKYLELKNTDPEQAKKLGRAWGFESNEGQKLSVFDSKIIDTASNEYSKLSSSANNYRMLADKIKAANLTSGAMGTLQEYGKEFLGEQDTNTELRKTVAQVVNSEAMKFLPPGSTTEKELFLAREPMPTGKANSEYVARWLTAVANLNDYAAKFAEHKANFIAANGGQRNPETGETVLSSWKAKQAEQAPAAQRYKVTVKGQQ